MAASLKTLQVAAAVALVATAALLPAATATKKKTFTVGDDAGWDVGVDYEEWASGKKFKVGDTLVFRHNAGQDVVQVDEQSFNDCVERENSKVLGGAANEVHVVLGQSGRFFFICDAEGECESGMKLAINVH